MRHSYEEIRAAAFQVLSERTRATHSLDEYPHLKIEVGKVLDAYDKVPAKLPRSYPADDALSREDAESLREVFWDLFRQGILTLGKDEGNNTFPFFRITSFGAKAVQDGDIYFISDTTAFEQQVRGEIPDIDAISLLYLKESFQAFRSGCLLSSAVMLGVTAEHLFELLLDQLTSDPKHSPRFSSVFKERSILSKIDKFKIVIAADKTSFPKDVKETFDTQFLGIQSIIRTYRNESGHPTGRVIDRDQAFINLRLFIPFGKMVHQLMKHYK
jgi:hypothetical protein